MPRVAPAAAAVAARPRQAPAHLGGHLAAAASAPGSRDPTPPAPPGVPRRRARPAGAGAPRPLPRRPARCGAAARAAIRARGQRGSRRGSCRLSLQRGGHLGQPGLDRAQPLANPRDRQADFGGDLLQGQTIHVMKHRDQRGRRGRVAEDPIQHPPRQRSALLGVGVRRRPATAAPRPRDPRDAGARCAAGSSRRWSRWSAATPPGRGHPANPFAEVFPQTRRALRPQPSARPAGNDDIDAAPWARGPRTGFRCPPSWRPSTSKGHQRPALARIRRAQPAISRHMEKHQPLTKVSPGLKPLRWGHELRWAKWSNRLRRGSP